MNKTAWFPYSFQFIYTSVPVDTELGSLFVVLLPQALVSFIAAVGRTDFRQTK